MTGIYWNRKYHQLWEQYQRDTDKLHLALKDLYDDYCGNPKACGHDYDCDCAENKAREIIELFES